MDLLIRVCFLYVFKNHPRLFKNDRNNPLIFHVLYGFLEIGSIFIFRQHENCIRLFSFFTLKNEEISVFEKGKWLKTIKMSFKSVVNI